MPDLSPPASTTQPQGLQQALMALMAAKKGQGGMPGSSPEGGMPSGSAGHVEDTSAASASPEAQDAGIAPGVGSLASMEGAPPLHESGFMGAIKGLLKLFESKPASASNDKKYQKALEEAGVPAEETGIGGGAQ